MKEPFILSKDQFLLIEDWTAEDPRLTAGFTTKNGGIGKTPYFSLNTGFHVGDLEEDVRGNRQILAKELDFPIENWTGAEQTHDIRIVKVKSADSGKGASDYTSGFLATDGLYTSDRNVLLTLCFADCVPLFFYAPKHVMVGTAHAGWKGTVSDIAGEMIRRWNEEGIASEDIFAAIGPSICRNCYIVDDRVMSRVQKLLEDSDEKPYNLISHGQFQLDLKMMNQMLIEKAGVPKDQIQISSLCTSCHQDLFFSHRRDKGKTGRMLGFIGWKED
ncbi:peptidoglycan editing factor PgeF [Bacillus massiliglaciei]|uniref:peptidoglycan editing factor PgeF n=1 Tax=Bacillus massiliglaciei TaxID=1816693 RepID=UPI000A74E2FF|nr:peptidoglycan editing factor PgeF [Bacillus massiliglaciei]